MGCLIPRILSATGPQRLAKYSARWHSEPRYVLMTRRGWPGLVRPSLFANALNNDREQAWGREVFFTNRSWKSHGPSGATQQGHAWSDGEQAWASAFYWGPRWELRVSQAHSGLVNLKFKSGNESSGRGKTSSSNGQ